MYIVLGEILPFKSHEELLQHSRKYYATHKEKYQKYREEHREQAKEYNRTRFINHPERYEKMLERNRERRERLKKEGVLLLGGKCALCGYSKFLGALEFHHIDPKDKDSKSDYMRNDFKLKIMDGKIQLLCSNCHKEIHLSHD